MNHDAENDLADTRPPYESSARWVRTAEDRTKTTKYFNLALEVTNA